MQSATTGATEADLAALREIIERGVHVKASDVHLHAGYPPMMRIAGNIVPMGEES